MNELIKRLEMERELMVEGYNESTGKDRAYFLGALEALEVAIKCAKEY